MLVDVHWYYSTNRAHSGERTSDKAHRFYFFQRNILANSKVGDSIAVNGVCLTITDMTADCFKTDVSWQTLACTTLVDLTEGAVVNLENHCVLTKV